MCVYTINWAVLKIFLLMYIFRNQLQLKIKNIEDSICVSHDTHYESAKAEAVIFSHFVWYSEMK